MLALSKSLALLLLASASGIQSAQATCASESLICSEAIAEGCDTTGLFTGDFVVTSANATTAPSCTATQYAYVTGLTVTKVTTDDAAVSFSYAVQPVGNSTSTCKLSDKSCENATPLTCGKGSDQNASVTITCTTACELKYHISWGCADLTTSDASSRLGSNTTSSSTTPNGAWPQVSAGLLGLAITAIAALSQI